MNMQLGPEAKYANARPVKYLLEILTMMLLHGLLLRTKNAQAACKY